MSNAEALGPPHVSARPLRGKYYVNCIVNESQVACVIYIYIYIYREREITTQ